MSSRAHRFLDAYRQAFEAFDASAIAELFLYPCHVTSDTDKIEVAPISSREEWLPQIERLIGAYRAIGVRSADARRIEVVELTRLLAHATVRSAVVDEADETIYEFDAAYTLAGDGDDVRISALAHNEVPRLRAALERRRG